jgi:hypothetical protein
MLFFQGFEKSHGDSRGPQELAKDLLSSFASITKAHAKEDSMCWSSRSLALLLISGFFVATAARAQTPVDEIGPLPATSSTEQLQLLPQPGPAAMAEPQQQRARRRLPKPSLLLSPEELSYREAVRELGVDTHRFVHCDLPNGKVRTGVITSIRDDGFMLKDGIVFSQWIRYTDLKAAPPSVPAVGTRIGQGFKWAGLVAGGIVVAPLALVFYPLIAAGVIAD